MKHTVDTMEVESGWMVLKGHDPNRRMVKATLVISDERVFTESEVKAIVEEIVKHVEGYYFDRAEIAEMVSKHGIVLDPA